MSIKGKIRMFLLGIRFNIRYKLGLVNPDSFLPSEDYYNTKEEI